MGHQLQSPYLLDILESVAHEAPVEEPGLVGHPRELLQGGLEPIGRHGRDRTARHGRRRGLSRCLGERGPWCQVHRRQERQCRIAEIKEILKKANRIRIFAIPFNVVLCN